jgi:hypothetical protein
MAYALFDYVSENGKNEFKTWTQGLEGAQRGKLNSKIRMLEQHGDGLFPELLTSTGAPGILKLRIKGNVQLRPMLCRGPVNTGAEYTFLLGAKEVGGKLVPTGADQIAAHNKDRVVANPENRRKKHEHVG